MASARSARGAGARFARAARSAALLSGDDDLGHAVDGCRYDRNAARHGLHDRAGEALPQTRHGEDVKGGEQPGDIVALPGEEEPVANARFHDEALGLRPQGAVAQPDHVGVGPPLAPQTRAMSSGAFWMARRGGSKDPRSARNAEHATGVTASCGNTWDAVDRINHRADALRRSDLQPHGFRGHERSVREEIVPNPAKPSFDRPKRAPNDRRLEFVEREAMKGVDDGGASHAVSGDPSHASGPARMVWTRSNFRSCG